MTVICWDGKYLAVDSRRTNKTEAKVSNDSEKIDLQFRRLKFCGEQIRAVAQAGSTRTTRYLKAILRQESDEFLKFVESRHEQGDLNDYRKGTLIIVTDKNVWSYQINGTRKPSLTLIDSSKPFAAGSGRGAAEAFMSLLFLSAPEAAGAVTLHKPCCGGPIRYVRCRGVGAKNADVETLEYGIEDDLRRAVLRRIRRNCKTLMDELK